MCNPQLNFEARVFVCVLSHSHYQMIALQLSLHIYSLVTSTSKVNVAYKKSPQKKKAHNRAILHGFQVLCRICTRTIHGWCEADERKFRLNCDECNKLDLCFCNMSTSHVVSIANCCHHHIRLHIRKMIYDNLHKSLSSKGFSVIKSDEPHAPTSQRSFPRKNPRRNVCYLLVRIMMCTSAFIRHS